VRSGPGAARTILFFRIISARPPKQPRMVLYMLIYIYICVKYIYIYIYIYILSLYIY
jgi:hypothetical protein